MSETMMATAAPVGTRGFDCNTIVGAGAAARMIAEGHRFAVRYIPREVARSGDLTGAELRLLTSAGLGVMPVQHVERDGPPWWTPTDDKGRRYGATAASYCADIGVPKGVTVWLDLEGIKPDVDVERVVRYCNYWHDRVIAAGYQPGVYVGFGARLSPNALYRRLKFQRYWAAYNLNTDQYPAVRGVCLRQRSAQPPAGIGFPIDGDIVTGDAFGGLPMLAAAFAALPG